MAFFSPLNTEPTPILQKIEVATFFQLPSFHLVGLPGPEVSEAKERIRAAIDSCQLPFPKGRVVVNLSPADIKKRGTGMDLAMALGVLASAREVQQKVAAWGELGLDGAVKEGGQMTRSLYAAWKGNAEVFFLCATELNCAAESLRCLAESEEMLGPAPQLIPVSSLKDAWEKLIAWVDGKGGENDPLKSVQEFVQSDGFEGPSEAVLSLLPLVPSLERLVGVVVSGKHHFLILGPRGVGKSQLVEWMISLQPELSPQDRLRQRLLLELAQLTSQSSHSHREPARVPIRWVGPQARPAALVGGCVGGLIRPGEYSLAHGGLLIADEFPEWNRDTRESLREPLERRKISITRAQGSFELPSEFQFIGTGNLCPCGGWPAFLGPPSLGSGSSSPLGAGGAVARCRCQSHVANSYLSRLSGPVLDRMDCVLVWKGRAPSDLTYPLEETQSRLENLKTRVAQARKTAQDSWGGAPGRLTGAQIEEILTQRYSESWNQFLKSGVGNSSDLSLRARHKIARVALSLCAWDGAEEPSWAHWMEASYYRPEKALSAVFDA